MTSAISSAPRVSWRQRRTLGAEHRYRYATEDRQIGASAPASSLATKRREGVCWDRREQFGQLATSTALTMLVGVSLTSSSPGTPLRVPYSSARSRPM